MTRLSRRLFRRPKGQALPEFALVLPVLMLILLIGIDFGRVYLGWVELNNAARIGANFAALHPASWGSPGNANDRAAYESAILTDAAAINCTLPAPLPTPAFPDGPVLGGRAAVDLTCSFDLITPFIGNLIGDPLPVGAQAVFPIRSGAIAGPPLQTSAPTPTPTPTPTPAPTAAPTPTPSPTPCIQPVPQLIGQRVNTAQSTWTNAGFTGAFNVLRPPQGNYTVASQSLTAGQQQACSAAITVGP